jgi:hypothetical protein
MDTFLIGKSDSPCLKQDQISVFVSSAVEVSDQYWHYVAYKIRTPEQHFSQSLGPSVFPASSVETK